MFGTAIFCSPYFLTQLIPTVNFTTTTNPEARHVKGLPQRLWFDFYFDPLGQCGADIIFIWPRYLYGGFELLRRLVSQGTGATYQFGFGGIAIDASARDLAHY